MATVPPEILSKLIRGKNIILKRKLYEKVPDWVRTNILANTTLFLLGSAFWFYGVNTRTYDRDYDEPGGEKTGPYLEHRTYARALRDAYWPLVNGTFDPTFAWYLTTSLMIIFATASLAVSKNKKKQTPEELANDIENFAERFHFNASTAKEILKIAPEVVEHLPDEIRVYFDMIKNGDFSLKDKKFLDIIANTLAHYLQTHPEDMKIIMSAIGYTGLPKDARALYKTLMNGNAK